MSTHPALYNDESSSLAKSLIGLSGQSNFSAFSNGSNNRDFAPTYWDSPSRLTFSLAPDTTKISRYKSSLFSSFSETLTAERLKTIIADAFQVWARNSNLNFGLVEDKGDSFGSGGPTQGDSRFGDIRFGAIPLGDEVFAVSIPNDEAISGTWAGDILLNSKAKFESVNQLRSVLIHEIGHSLGLEHSDDPRSVMHVKSSNLRLGASDIGNLQAIYGERQLDQYDVVGDRNDSLDDATRIRHSGSIRGSIPFVVYGDIENANDVDYFYLRPVNKYNGPVTFRVVSEGISRLQTELTLFDENGTSLGRSVSKSIFGSDHSITINGNDEDDIYVRIRRIGGRATNFGSYSLVATFDGLAQYDAALLEKTIHSDFSRLEQDDVQTIFTDPIPVFNNDLHTNDTIASATDIEVVPGLASQHVFRVQAGLNDLIDIDYYRFSTPDFGGTNGILTARIFAQEQGGLISKLLVLDANGNAVDHQVITNGNGEFVIQVDNVDSNSDYYIRVIADRPGEGFDIGNYDLNISFDRSAYTLTSLGSGLLGIDRNQRRHTLYVAETQLFHLGLNVEESPSSFNSTIWLTVYSETGEAVFRTATRPGEFRTAKSVVLQPGSYVMQTVVTFERVSGLNNLLRFEILGKGIGDPIGPELINPANRPFPKCDPKTDEYCYPGDRHTTDAFIVVAGGEVRLPPGSSTPPAYNNINTWYWYQNWLGDSA